MELYWYIVVIIFIIVKILFYVCWYRSRQRQLAAYLSNPRNAQIVIVGGRAYLHQVCERQSTSIWPRWYSVEDGASMEEPSTTTNTTTPHPPAAAFSQLDMPPPYEAVSGEEDLKPPSYSECARSDGGPPPHPSSHHHHHDDHRIVVDAGAVAVGVNEAPPPYTPSPLTPANQPPDAPARPSQ